VAIHHIESNSVPKRQRLVLLQTLDTIWGCKDCCWCDWGFSQER